MEAPTKPDADGIYPCCKIAENLEWQVSDNSNMDIKKCKVCNRRHYTLHAEPGRFGVVGKNLGK